MAAPRKKKTQWRLRKDPLWRGDGAALTMPEPTADASIVRHVLYLGGAGRPTPYHSATEVQSVAGMFAGTAGRVRETTVPHAERARAIHLGRIELIRLLQGLGQGKAKWHSALEVMQARRYVEQWHEHLLSFTDLAGDSDSEIQAAVLAAYK